MVGVSVVVSSPLCICSCWDGTLWRGRKSMVRQSRSLHARPEAAGVTGRGWDKEHLSQAHLRWPTFFSQVLYFVKASTLGHVCTLLIKLQQSFHGLSRILVSPESWDTALRPRGVLCYYFDDFFLSMISPYEILSSFSWCWNSKPEPSFILELFEETFFLYTISAFIYFPPVAYWLFLSHFCYFLSYILMLLLYF